MRGQVEDADEVIARAATNARPAANTTSAGSSFACRVSVTMPRETETTLTLSETSFTTHTSSLFSGFTETGSMPTGISATRIGFEGFDVSNTESRASGVLTANSRVPSGESRAGAVCLPSKLTKVGSVSAASHSIEAKEQAATIGNE